MEWGPATVTRGSPERLKSGTLGGEGRHCTLERAQMGDSGPPPSAKMRENGWGCSGAMEGQGYRDAAGGP